MGGKHTVERLSRESNDGATCSIEKTPLKGVVFGNRTDGIMSFSRLLK